MSSSVTNTQDWRGKLDSLVANFDINTILQSRWVQQTPLWLNILMVVLLAYAFAEFTWRVITPATSYTTTPQHASSGSQQRQAARLDSVSDMHLFGVAKTDQIQQQNIKKTQLRLSLHGVFASTDPAQAVAIISQSKGEAGKAYKVGATVPGGAVVHQVKSNEVILKRNGRLESLPLPRERLSKPITKRSTKRASAVRNVQANQKLRNLQNTFAKNPKKFWRNIRIEPQMDKATNQIKGYSIFHNDPSVMQSLGIKPGDIVTMVDGQSVADPTVGIQLMNKFKSGNRFSLTVERNGQTQAINVNMR